MERPPPMSNHRTLYENITGLALEKIRLALPRFVCGFPHVSQKGIYHPEENALWTAAFFPGMACLAYAYTGDRAFLAHGEKYLDSFEERLDDRRHITHDLGFLATLFCHAYDLSVGSPRARTLLSRARDMLAERFHEKGGYLQAWGDMTLAYPDVKIIIDTMLNLSLFYHSDTPAHRDMARRHALLSAKTLMRPDGSSFHTYLMNPETGEPVEGRTHQGFRDHSTWARGQAWAVYGFALSYRHTGDALFLDTAKRAAGVFIKNLPGDLVPYWDFTFTDENPDIRDTSAAAIFACGLLELAALSEDPAGGSYRRVADDIMVSLCSHYIVQERERLGLLSEGMYHRDVGARECVIWGDYFFLEALCRLQGDWVPWW